MTMNHLEEVQKTVAKRKNLNYQQTFSFQAPPVTIDKESKIFLVSMEFSTNFVTW